MVIKELKNLLFFLTIFPVTMHGYFNWVKSNVFRAINEITRMVCVIVMLAVATWA